MTVAAFLVSIVAGCLLGTLENQYHTLSVFLFSAGMFYVSLLILAAVPLVSMSLICGVMTHFRIWRNRILPGRLWLFHGIAVTGAAVLGILAGMLVVPPVIQVLKSGVANIGLLRIFPGIFLLAALVGAVSGRIGPEGEEARSVFISVTKVFEHVGMLLLKFLPAGVFLLLCPLVSARGLSVLWPLVKLMLVAGFSCAAYGVAVCGFQLYRCGKDCPRHFFRCFKQVVYQAVSGGSSSGCEETALRNLRRLGITNPSGLNSFSFGKFPGNIGTVLYLGIVCTAAVKSYNTVLPVMYLAATGLLIWILLLSRAKLDYPGAGLFCALSLLLIAGLPPETAVPILLCEGLLNSLRTALNMVFAGTGAYLSDKLGWMKDH